MPRFAEQQLYISGQYVAASSGETWRLQKLSATRLLD